MSNTCTTCKSRPKCDIFAENGEIENCPVWASSSQYTVDDNDEGGDKAMSFLQKVRELSNETGVCRTCGNIERISEKLIGCTAHDKLILPDFPPYHGKAKCKDYKRRGESDGKVPNA